MGFLGYSPQSFFYLEPTECLDILEQREKKIKFDHTLMYVAIVNAIGSTSSKDYVYQDIFEKNKNAEYTDEEYEGLMEELKKW